MNGVTFHRMKTQLLEIIDETEDSIRFYKLPEDRERRVEEYRSGKCRGLQRATGSLTRTWRYADARLEVRAVADREKNSLELMLVKHKIKGSPTEVRGNPI